MYVCIFVMFWLRGATHHAVSLRSLAPRLRAHVPAQCRTLLRCTDVRGFTTTLRNRNWAVWQKKSSALSTSDKLSRLPQRTIGTLWNSLVFSHVSLIRYLMHLDAGHKPSILQRSWKLRPSRGPVILLFGFSLNSLCSHSVDFSRTHRLENGNWKCYEMLAHAGCKRIG